jgi:DNA invertase Pin-like site-specific DNA recombinase
MTENAGRWLRVSTGDQNEANQGPDIDRWIADHGYHQAKTYTIHGKSAYKGEQAAAIEQAIADMEAGLITVLVVWAADRIERRGALDTLILAARAREAGGRIEYVRDAHLNITHDFADSQLAQAADIARAESKRKSERVLASFGTIDLNGALIGRAPFGYMIVGEKYSKRLVPHPVNAQAIRDAVAHYLDDGWSLRQVCDWLESRGVEPAGIKDRPVKGWHTKSLSRLFRSESLMGRHRVRRRVLKIDPPVIDRATWNRLQATMDQRASTKGIPRGDAALLSGIICCDKCKGPMYRMNAAARRRDGTRVDYYYYRCQGLRAASQCANMVPVGYTDAWVDEQVSANPSFVIQVTVIAGDGHEEDIESVEQDLRELDYDDDKFLDRQAELLAERARLKSAPGTPARIEEKVMAFTVGEMWAGLDDAGKRAHLLGCGVKVYASREERRSAATRRLPPAPVMLRMEGDPARLNQV